MIGEKIEVDRLIKICNTDIQKKCADESEKIRKEIMRKLLSSNKVIGIISYSKSNALFHGYAIPDVYQKTINQSFLC